MAKRILQNKQVILISERTDLISTIEEAFTRAGATVVCLGCSQTVAPPDETIPDVVLIDAELSEASVEDMLKRLGYTHMPTQSVVLMLSEASQPVYAHALMGLGISEYVGGAYTHPAGVVEKAVALLQKKEKQGARSTQEAGSLEEQVRDLLVVKKESKSKKIVPADPNARMCKVLIIEDDAMIRDMLAEKLQKEGCLPLLVGPETEIVTQALAFEPQVILLDLLLPGVDGLSILKRLKQHTVLRQIPVIVFSNKSSSADKEKALKLGAARYYIKAVTDINTLTAEIFKLIRAQA